MGRDLTTPAAAGHLSLRARSSAELSDRVLAGLVLRRLAMLRKQGGAAFALFGAALATLIMAAIAGPSELILGFAGAGIASLAMGLGFCVERFAWWRFREEGRLNGLSDEATRAVYLQAADAEDMLDVMRACGTEPSDAELARFVR